VKRTVKARPGEELRLLARVCCEPLAGRDLRTANQESCKNSRLGQLGELGDLSMPGAGDWLAVHF